MTDNFLSTQEQECLLAQGNNVKIQQRIQEIGQTINKLLCPNSMMIKGEKVEVSFGLDDLTPERFEEITPKLKELVAEYHLLRKSQKEVLAKINQLHSFNLFKVDMK